MGLRFHRSIKIANGVRLNISKQGLGVSLGPRGAKISFGPSGVYSNVGIPGTGISSRKKLNSNSSQQRTSSSGGEELSVDVRMSIDDETGEEEITIRKDGTEIYDKRLLRKIKSDDSFKKKLQEFRKRACGEINEKTEVLVNVHKYSSSIPDWDGLLEDSKTRQPERYFKRGFPKKMPDIVDVTKMLQIQACDEVNPIFFKNKKRKEYVESRKDRYLEVKVDEWKAEKEKFEEQERENEIRINESNRIEFENWLKEVKLTFEPTADFLKEKLDQYFSEVQMPVDFNVSFDVMENGRRVYLDIDLPEIEDYPQKKARILASGKVSVKYKSMKEKKSDYLRSVSAMSIYFASIVFSISPAIEEVVVSGYTQRVNKASGNIQDEYVYSVKYGSKQFAELNIDNIEPELTLKSFEHRIKTTAQYDMRPIVPFEVLS